MDVLLDTNCYNLVISGDKEIYNYLKKANTIYFSTVVIGELFAGFEGGRKKEENIECLDIFLAGRNVVVIGISRKTAEIYGNIVFNLRSKGMPIPINDIWIAAQALQIGAVLITMDKHFLQIENLNVWDKL